MKGNEYQILASRTINKQLNKEQKELHALHGLVGEVGEIHSLFQKVYQGHKMNEEHLKKEFGDLLWFIAEFCTVKNWTLEEIMELNISKLEKRYSEGFSVEESLHRQNGDV